jgi:hypothetical protein
MTFAEDSRMYYYKEKEDTFVKVENDPLADQYEKMKGIAFHIDLSDKEVQEKFSMEWLNRLTKWIEVQLSDAAETKFPFVQISKQLALNVSACSTAKQLFPQLEQPGTDKLEPEPSAKGKTAVKRKSVGGKKKADNEFDYGTLVADVPTPDFGSVVLPVTGSVSHRRAGLGQCTQIACLTVSNYAKVDNKSEEKENAAEEKGNNAAEVDEEEKGKKGNAAEGDHDDDDHDRGDQAGRGNSKYKYSFEIPIFTGSIGAADVFSSKVTMAF